MTMATNTPYKQIALTDFKEHVDVDLNDALDRMGTILEDGELCEIRIAMLHGIADAAHREGYTREPKDLDHAIREVGRLGIWDAHTRQDNGVDFEQLASIFNDAEALAKTRELFLAFEIEEPVLEPREPKTFADLLCLLLDVSPDERGARYLQSENAYLFDCELAAIAGGADDENAGQSNHHPRHLNSDEVFFAEIPEVRNPHGLCRMSLFLDAYCETEPVADSLIELELENGEWLIEVAVRDLFEDEVPDVKQLFVCLTFADEHNFAAFSSDSVHRFVDQLAEGEQKRKASDYLAKGTEQ